MAWFLGVGYEPPPTPPRPNENRKPGCLPFCGWGTANPKPLTPDFRGGREGAAWRAAAGSHDSPCAAFRRRPSAAQPLYSAWRGDLLSASSSKKPAELFIAGRLLGFLHHHPSRVRKTGRGLPGTGNRDVALLPTVQRRGRGVLSPPEDELAVGHLRWWMLRPAKLKRAHPRAQRMGKGGEAGAVRGAEMARLGWTAGDGARLKCAAEPAAFLLLTQARNGKERSGLAASQRKRRKGAGVPRKTRPCKPALVQAGGLAGGRWLDPTAPFPTEPETGVAKTAVVFKHAWRADPLHSARLTRE